MDEFVIRLTRLGLTGYEARAYLVLTSRDSFTAAEVARQANLIDASARTLQIRATDPGAPADLPAWCRMTGHTLVSQQHPTYLIRRKES